MQIAALLTNYVDEASVPDRGRYPKRRRRSCWLRWLAIPRTLTSLMLPKQKMIEGQDRKVLRRTAYSRSGVRQDGDLSVAQYTTKVAKDLGGSQIVKVHRFVKGEGSLEKRC